MKIELTGDPSPSLVCVNDMKPGVLYHYVDHPDYVYTIACTRGDGSRQLLKLAPRTDVGPNGAPLLIPNSNFDSKIRCYVKMDPGHKLSFSNEDYL